MENVIEQKVKIEAPVARVWHALTDYQEFGEWFCVKLDAPFVPGQLSTGHMTYPGYEHLKWESMVQKMEPETIFSFTWHPYAIDPEVDYSSETPTLVEFKLEPTSTGTLILVRESGFENVPEHRRAEAFEMDSYGWGAQMTNIRDYVTKQQ